MIFCFQFHPQINPITQKPMKPPKKLHKQPPSTLSRLGGIFSIDGWDKPETEKAMKSEKLPEIHSLPKIPKVRQLPKIEIPLVDQEVLEAAHASFMEMNEVDMASEPERNEVRTERKPSPIRFVEPEPELPKESPKPGKFDRFDSGNDSESDEDVVKPVASKKPTISDSESDTGEKQEPPSALDDDSEDEQPSPKRAKLDLSIDDDNLVVMDNDNLDDLESDTGGDEDYVPPKSYLKKPPQLKPEPINFSCELNDLNLKIFKEKTTAQQEFDRNTENISNGLKKLEDPANPGLMRFFPDVCLDFLKLKTCADKACKHKHQLLQLQEYSAYFLMEKVPLKDVEDFYRVCQPIQWLFTFFFPLFADAFTAKTKIGADRETKIARLIMDCEFAPRFQAESYKVIVKALERDMKRHEALKLVIKHYQASEIADDAIFQLAVSCGASAFHFMPFFEKIDVKRLFPAKYLNCLIANCVEHENISLTIFCVNRIVARSGSQEQCRQINKQELDSFCGLLQKLFSDESFKQKVVCVAHITLQKADLK